MLCNKCGSEIDDDSEFCSKCGTKVKHKKEMSKGKRIFVIVLLSILFMYFSILIVINIKNVGKMIEEGNRYFYISIGILLFIAYGIIRNISKLRGKEFTAEQLKKRKKRNIIISGIIIFAIAILSFIVPMLNNKKNNLQYNTKYVYEDSYITFFEDGTYTRNVEGITIANYTFNNETKEIICNEIQNVDGYEMDLEIFFKYLNEDEIQKTSMKVLGSVPNGVEFGEIYSTENILKEKQENKTEKQEIIKDTRMLHEEDNYEYIGFSSNGLTRMLLAFYEDGRLGIRTHTLNKYNGNYEQVGDIQWGTYQVKHNVIYAGNTMMTITSPDEVSKVQLFKYNGMEFTAIEVNNDNINADLDTLNNSSTNGTEINDNLDNIDREELLDNNYNTAVAEIKKCLKDVNWLKQNIYITEDEMISNDADISDQEINFIVCKSDTKPIIVVETSSFNNLFIKIDIVTYENNKVKVKRIGEGHNSHVGYSIDANKCVARTGYMHMGDCKTLLHSIVDGKISLLGSYGYYEEYISNTDDNVELKYTYYIGFDTNFNNNKEVSEDEYERYKKNLNEEQYNFVSIGTRLTSENVDLYINGY